MHDKRTFQRTPGIHHPKYQASGKPWTIQPSTQPTKQTYTSFSSWTRQVKRKRGLDTWRSRAPSSCSCQGDLLGWRLQASQPCSVLVPGAPAPPALAGSPSTETAPCWDERSILGTLITQEQKQQRRPILLHILNAVRTI